VYLFWELPQAICLAHIEVVKRSSEARRGEAWRSCDGIKICVAIYFDGVQPGEASVTSLSKCDSFQILEGKRRQNSPSQHHVKFKHIFSLYLVGIVSEVGGSPFVLYIIVCRCTISIVCYRMSVNAVGGAQHYRSNRFSLLLLTLLCMPIESIARIQDSCRSRRVRSCPTLQPTNPSFRSRL
jgi:hypothetical protein